jgi:hypothetical protein
VDEAPLLADVLPQLAERMTNALRESGETHLAKEVAALRVTDVCRCGEPYCGSFYTARWPMKRWFRRGRQVELGDGLPGNVTLDVVAGEIVYVEVLFWDEVRDAIARVSLTR